MSGTTCKTAAEPLFLDIAYHNISLDGSAVPSWGIAIAMGDSMQKFSLYPSVYDDTLLLNAEHCSASDSACLASGGGIYDPRLSTTEVTAASASDWNGTLGGNDPSYYSLYNDIVTFGSNETSAWGFPFTTDDADGWATQCTLGVGLNSSFLHTLIGSEMAPSESWGLWVGSHSAENEQAGLLIVGGYDDARVAHDFSTFPSTTECPACITIENLTWVDDSGATPLTNETTTYFQISLMPDWTGISLPAPLFEAFGVATNGVYDAESTLYSYPASFIPEGSLTFNIKNGYSTSIPASELFHFTREFDSDGTLIVTNNTYKIAMAQEFNNDNPDDGAVVYPWGTTFLTMNYLVMDIEQKQFRLSEAIRQDWGNEGGVALRKLCSGQEVITPEPKKTNVAAIAGEVCGGVGVLLIIALILFLWFRRNKKRRQQATGQARAPSPEVYQSVAPTGQQPYSPTGHQSYSPTGTYAYPFQGHMGYTDQPSPPSTYPVMAQYEYPKITQADYRQYDPPAAPQELPSPDPHPTEWRGSEISSDTRATRGASATFTSTTTYNQRSDLT